MPDTSKLQQFQEIADLLNVGVFPGSVAQALVRAQLYIAACVAAESKAVLRAQVAELEAGESKAKEEAEQARLAKEFEAAKKQVLNKLSQEEAMAKVAQEAIEVDLPAEGL